jgi:2-polyprenyl-6-methoxyphenol hydroxylase-like FAD-dependent oxidoreductase
LNLGLADAELLAQVLHEREYWRELGDTRLLRRYERARKGDVLALGWTTDGLQQLFAQPAEAFSLLRNWGMRGFDRSGPLKHWAVRQAMGGARNLLRTGRP